MGAAVGGLNFGLASNAVIGRPFIVATNAAYVNTANTVNVPIPSEVIAGDMILYVAAHVGTPNLPANHQIPTVSGAVPTLSGTNINGRAFYKIAAGTEGGTNQTVTFTTSNTGEVVVMVIRGGVLQGFTNVRTTSTTAGQTVTSAFPVATATVKRDNLVLHTAIIRATSATVRSNNGVLVRSQSDAAFASSVYQQTATSTTVGGSWSPSIATSGLYGITTTFRPILQATGSAAAGVFPRALSAGALVGAGVTADVISLLAIPGTTTIGGDIAVTGVTATISAAAIAGTATIEQFGVAVNGATAIVDVQARPGTAQLGGGSSVPGDFFATPIELNGLSGSVNVDLLNSTVESAEPDSSLIAHSVWLALRPDIAGGFTITSTHTGSFNHSIEVFDGDTFAELELLGFSDWVDGSSTSAASVALQVAENGPYFIRLTPYNLAAGGNASISFTWVIVDRTPALIQDIRTPILDETPSNVFVSILNGFPFEDIEFTLGGTVLYTEQTDASGVIQGINIPVPGLNAGTYNITATGLSSGRSDTDSFQVANDEVTAPTGPAPDAPPVAVPQVGVRKWVLQDPVAGGTSFTFTYNPSEMKPIFAPRFIEVEHTTSPVGIPVLWEGVRRAHEWEFSGYLDSDTDMLALTAFYNLNHRFFLIDHRNRAWIVVFDGLDLQPKRNNEKPFAHNYTVKALIFGEGIQL